jgi:hypothetical protein
MLIDEIKNIKESKSDLRKFGLTVGTVLTLLGVVLFLFSKPSYLYFIIPGVLLLILGLTIPQILRPLNKVWMALALIMGWIMTRVILSILFYLGLTTISLLAKLFGKKFLELKIDRSKESYWIKRENKKITPTDLERQF